MNLRKIAVIGLMTTLAVGAAAQDDSTGVELRFRHREGDILHADGFVQEFVYINGFYSHNAGITESSVTRILSVDPDGKASLESEFITTESISGYLEWVSSETVVLDRDIRGAMDVPADAARPVLRDIPVFPEEPVSPGDSWTADAREVHVFRIGGRLWGPYSGDFPVSYVFESEEIRDGRRLALVSISYNLYLPVRQAGEPVRMVSGTSEGLLYWDIEAGEPVMKEEAFEFVIMMSDGTSQEIVGSQEVDYRSLRELDRDKVLVDLQDAAGADVAVSDTDSGILLTIDETDRILFAPESAEISKSQGRLLLNLSAVLEQYPERDILISGHTAAYGTAEGRQLLSRQRAEAVAGLLFPEGRPGPGGIYLRGMGADAPVGSDAENRRVEILILD